jgi:hypothetical protein
MTFSAKEMQGTTISADGSESSVHAIIYPPKQERGQSTWTCTVHCPFLFEKDKCLVGIDADQAAELAEKFLLDLFEHNEITIAKQP